MTHVAPIHKLSEFVPDARRAAIPDDTDRNVYFKDALPSTHTSLVVNDTQTHVATELQRIQQVQVAAVSGGTVTIQVYVDGRPMFLTANRPVSGGAVASVDSRFHFPANAVVTTVIEATTGVPVGSANVVIQTEPYILVPRAEQVELKGRDRLFPSRRRAVLAHNRFGSNRTAATQDRRSSNIGRGDRDIGKNQGGGGKAAPKVEIPRGILPGGKDPGGRGVPR